VQRRAGCLERLSQWASGPEAERAAAARKAAGGVGVDEAAARLVARVGRGTCRAAGGASRGGPYVQACVEGSRGCTGSFETELLDTLVAQLPHDTLEILGVLETARAVERTPLLG
jgi:hypothetical protein